LQSLHAYERSIVVNKVSRVACRVEIPLPTVQPDALAQKMMEATVTKLFERYENFFNRSLGGDIDIDEVASLYASEFIAASPVGVMTGKNDDQFKQIMTQGYAHYRDRDDRQCPRLPHR
jgi:hypothetical protein